jgi:MoxR-like ATPase
MPIDNHVAQDYVRSLLMKINTKMEEKKLKENVSLLKYKKQIILQGPPGTGKTRKAKEIALEMMGTNGEIDLKNFLTKGSSIPNASGVEDYYLLENVTVNSVELSSERATKKWSASFNKIQEKLSQLQRGESPKNKGGDDPYVLAVAKYVFKKLANNSKLLVDNEQFKLIQFHPSYTYEDFVRGIVAKPTKNGNGILYEAENKTLGQFAQDALKNYNASKNHSIDSNIDNWIDEKFELFKNEIEAKLPEEETILSGDISIFEVSSNYFKYAKNWNTSGYIKFGEFKKLIKAIVKGELALSTKQLNKERFIHAHYRYTYYNSLLKIFFEQYNYKNETYSVAEKNYVLVIDEINRANLSSVLGELIYALEYREKAVESMYSVEDSVLDNKNQIILPPNLYIIGTMNTADRSVGHIDYAIRRRFAFVEVLPEELNDEKIVFQKELFKKVSALFINNYEAYIADKNTKLERAKTLAAEFRPEDVWLGHSYFIQTKEKDKDGKDILVPEDFNIRLEYEIKPILMEYVKDGILINTIKDGESEIKVEDYIKAL